MNTRVFKPGASAVLLLCLSAALVGCGGSSAGEEPVAVVAEDPIPTSAVASPEAFSRFAAGLADADSSEPLNVDNLVPPTSETAEPDPVQS
jgi:hypothetical protein